MRGDRPTLSPAGAVTASSGRRLSPKAQRTRETVLRASRVIFERDGLNEARVSDIAREAGVAHGTFYTYFDSKNEVFSHLMFEFFDAIRGAIHTSEHPALETPYETIYRTNRAYIEILHANARLVVLMWKYAANAVGELSARHQEEMDFFITRAERGIRRFQEQGAADPRVDARYVARALGCMVEQFCVQWFVNDLDFELEQSSQVLTEIWARAIGVKIPSSGATD